MRCSVHPSDERHEAKEGLRLGRVIAVGLAGLNAIIVVLVLVEEFNAPVMPVLIGCVWAVVGVYLLCDAIDHSRGAAK